MSIEIKTPRGQIIQNGKQTAKLSWADNFGQKKTEQFDATQKMVDSEVIRQSDPYVPMRTSMLKKSGIIGTVIGSGVVKYVAPYADKNYYRNAGSGQEGTASGGKRGKYWFERMKADHKGEILAKAKGKLKG